MRECMTHCNMNKECYMIQVSEADSFCGHITKTQGMPIPFLYDPNYLLVNKGLNNPLIRYPGGNNLNLNRYFSYFSYFIYLDSAAKSLWGFRQNGMEVYNVLRVKTSYNNTISKCQEVLKGFHFARLGQAFYSAERRAINHPADIGCKFQ